METERLVSLGYTNAEKALAANYAPGDVVAFHRACKRLGVGKGDELRADAIELRQGERIRWTRNDARHELVNSATAEVAAVKDGTVRFRVEDGRILNMRKDDPRLRHIDRAWASTVHAFQGRTVDTVIAGWKPITPT